jgi:alpha-N-arabinofuranosidase
VDAERRRTHEILDLAEALGLDVTLNVNWGRGTPTYAADWVEYVNGASSTTQGAARDSNGRTAPWGINSWEVGNEVWGWWTPGHTSDAQAFADSYVQFRDAMAARDPGIEFIAEGGDGNNTDETWNQTLLNTAADKLDHLSTHFYPPQSLPQNYNSLDVYLASVGAPATISDRLDGTQASILDTSDEDVKVATTEYNAMYFNEEHRRTRTLEAALQAAGQLNLFARRPQLIERNFYSTLMNFWDGGGIRLGNRGSFVTPAHEALRMFANHHGPVQLHADVSSATYSAQAIGNLPARRNIPYLDVTATRSSDGQKLFLSVINRHPTDALATTIDLTNFGAIADGGTKHELNSSSYLDKNTWQASTTVAPTTISVTGISSSFSHTFAAHSYTVLEVDASADPVDIASVTGRVTTTSGGAIAGATVDVGGIATGTTDADGYFLIPVATPGTYAVTATASGYAPSTLNSVEVRSTGATTLPIRLS